jgi:hypothetical protein
MAAVDYERAWLALKEVVLSKNSHGQRDLLASMSRIEVDSKLPEGELEAAQVVRMAHGRPSEQRPREVVSHGR